MASVDNLSLVQTQEGRYGEAEQWERENFDIRRRVLGPEHPDALFSQRNLGEILQREGHFAEAEKFQRQTLEVRRRLLGSDHPETLLSSKDLALTLQKEGQYAEAGKLFRESAEARARTLGADNAATLNAQEYLAIDLGYEKRDAEADKLFRDAIRTASDSQNRDALSVAWHIFACGAAVAGHPDDALSYLGKAVDLGYGHADTIAADADLKSLHGDSRFDALVAKARQPAAAIK
jgi:eukaryotic-like serine/threonine-protein kinase